MSTNGAGKEGSPQYEDAPRADLVDDAEKHPPVSLPLVDDADEHPPVSLPVQPGDLEVPNDEDLQTLRRVSDKIPFKAYTIAFVELVERMSFYGTTQVFVNFIQQPNPGTRTGKAVDPKATNAQPGALGLGQQASTGLTTFNQFWVYLIPLFGAYVADTYWGRYKAIWVSVLIAIAGHVILVASAAPDVIAAPHKALAAFVIGLIIMGIGTGGFKPNISPLVAEQVPNPKIHIREDKSMFSSKVERVIVDPQVTILRVYNWFYLFINIGALVGQISMTYAERYVGFYLAFLLPTVSFCIVLPILYGCRNWYRHTAPEGSVLGPALKLLFFAMKGRLHANPVQTYRHLNDGTFWEAVKPSNMDPSRRRAWMTYDDAWVDEVARGFRACSVFLWYPLYWLTYNQINNNLTSQAAVMNLHGLPNDIFSNLDPLALIILIPCFDIIFYPALRRMGFNFTPVKRITAGFFTGSAAMIWACVVQAYIYKRSACGRYASGANCANVDISVWAQSGSYILIAISEIFASITSLEYAFTKAPKNMRSLVMSFNLFMMAISAALGEAFVSLSADPLLVWNYGSMAVISFIGGVLFYLCFIQLDRDEDRLNALAAGHMHHDEAVGDVERKASGGGNGSDGFVDEPLANPEKAPATNGL